MRTVDDLRRSLEQHADLAGDPRGLVQAAREGAARIRRRRRMVRAGVSAAVVAVLVVAIPVVATRNLAEKLAPAPAPAASAPPADREFAQFTLDLRPAPGYVVEDITALPHRQEMTQASMRPLTAEDIDPGVHVVVFDPGEFNAGPLAGTERVTIAGRDAWFRPDFPLGGLGGWPADDARGPAVGWAEPSGAHVVVYRRPESTIRKAMLLEVAGTVRIGPPADVTVPFHLGRVPAGMKLADITVRQDADGRFVTLRGDDAGIRVWARPARDMGGRAVPEGTQLTVAGHPATAVDFPKNRRVVVPAFGTCWVMIETVDGRQTTRAELIRVLESMTVADCDDQTTWTRPDR